MENLSEVELGRVLETAYGFAGPEIALIRAGSDGNQTYRVTVDGRPFIARVYGAHGRENPEWARYELELLVHLAGHGVSVAEPIAARDGALMQLVPVAGGAVAAPVAVFAFADGGVEWPTTPPRAHLLGEAFARLHLAAGGFETSAAHRAFDLERLFYGPLRRIRPFLSDTDPVDLAAWETLMETAEHAGAIFEAVPDEGWAIGPIHGDLHQGNCHFEAGGSGDRVTFFDFSNAGTGWRVYDLSGFLWPMRDETIEKPEIRAACDAFLDGYRSVRPLGPEEERAIAASVKARDYWETGMWLEFDLAVDPEVVRAGLRSLAEQFRRFPLHAPGGGS